MKGIFEYIAIGGLFHSLLVNLCYYFSLCLFFVVVVVVAHFNHQINALILVFEFNNSYYAYGLCVCLRFLRCISAMCCFVLCLFCRNCHTHFSTCFNSLRWVKQRPGLLMRAWALASALMRLCHGTNEIKEIWKETRKMRENQISKYHQRQTPTIK